MRVLGIDPGTAVMGYGVVESVPGRPYRLLECGTLTTGARDPLPSRLRVLHDGVTALIARHTPDAVAVESAFYGKNVRTTVVLSHARGVILLAAEMAAVQIAEYSPAVVKKTVVGRVAGRRRRLQAKQLGHHVSHLSFHRRAAADGVAVALTHLMMMPQRLALQRQIASSR